MTGRPVPTAAGKRDRVLTPMSTVQLTFQIATWPESRLLPARLLTEVLSCLKRPRPFLHVVASLASVMLSCSMCCFVFGITLHPLPPPGQIWLNVCWSFCLLVHKYLERSLEIGVFILGISFRISMRNGLLSPQSVYRVSHLWNASCYRTSSKTVHIYKKLYIRKKKKRKLNWFLLFYCKRCIFQLLLLVSTVVVVDSHLHWSAGSSVWLRRCQQEIP